jgi:hypothetical protein
MHHRSGSVKQIAARKQEAEKNLFNSENQGKSWKTVSKLDPNQEEVSLFVTAKLLSARGLRCL